MRSPISLVSISNQSMVGSARENS